MCERNSADLYHLGHLTYQLLKTVNKLPSLPSPPQRATTEGRNQFCCSSASASDVVEQKKKEKVKLSEIGANVGWNDKQFNFSDDIYKTEISKFWILVLIFILANVCHSQHGDERVQRVSAIGFRRWNLLFIFIAPLCALSASRRRRSKRSRRCLVIDVPRWKTYGWWCIYSVDNIYILTFQLEMEI